MYVNNTVKKDICLTTFDGYTFTLPPGVSWIWDKAGEHLTTKIHKVESAGGVDKYGFSNGHGIPALLLSDEASWEKGGKKLTQVQRYVINEKLIPRAKMIIIARERGVGNDRIMDFVADPNIDVSEIAKIINELPVPDSIKYPANLERETVNV